MITPEEPLRLETVGVLRNGRRRYDPASKQRLVEACLQPGVSLAGLALQHGVNANLLRKWVAKRQLQNGDGQPEARAPIAPAFIPVRAPSPSPTRSAGAIAVCAILCRAADGIDAQRRDAFAGRRRRAVAVGGD
jgi:transposase